MKKFNVLLVLLAAMEISLLSCKGGKGAGEDGSLGGSDTSNYKVVSISNSSGCRAKFCSNGARLMSLLVPDKNGKLVDVVMGFGSPAEYDKSTEPYFGATIGRYGNRIAKGRFVLDGVSYSVPVNNGVNALHGGASGFQSRRWMLRKVSDSAVVCTLISPDGDMGFPGKLYAKVTYTVSSRNELLMEYEARSEKTTVVNLTNHAFFNLNGSGSILEHSLMINASSFLPVDSGLIPTGQIAEVAGTPFDFRTSALIGSRIETDDVQLRYGKGYDHNYVLNRSVIMPAAVVVGDKSGIMMRVYTKEPGMQFYSGNFMKGENELRTGPDLFRTAFCLETQHYPDSPNQPSFPSTVLRPGEVYRTRSVYAFSVAR